MHPAAGDQFDDVEDLLPVGEGIKNRGHGPHIGGEGAEPDEMAGDAEQLGQHHPDDYCPVGDDDAAEPLHRIDIGQIVLHPGQVIDPVGVGDELVPVLSLGDLLRPTVVIADIQVHIDDLLPRQLEDAADNAVGAGVLGPEVEDHGILVRPLEKIACRQRLVLAGIIGRVRRHLRRPEGVLLAQRVSLPVVGHENPPQIGVAAETDAEHVVHLPLVPGGSGKDRGSCLDFGPYTFGSHLEAQMPGGVEVEQMVIDAEIGKPVPLLAAGVVHRDNVLQAAKRRTLPPFQMAQHLGERIRCHPVGEHVRRPLIPLHPAGKEPLQLSGQAEVGVVVPGCRRPPHLVRTGEPGLRMADGDTAHGDAGHPRTARVARLAFTVHQHRPGRPLGPAGEMQHRPGRPFIPADFFLQQHQPLHERLRPGGAAGYIDIHRDDLVHPLHHAVDVVHAPGVGAAPHGDHPARLGHLLVEAEDGGCHLLEDRAGDDHQVSLPRRAAQHLGTEAGDVVAGGERSHHLHETAGEPEKHRPERIRPPPVDQVIQVGQEYVVGGICLRHEVPCMKRYEERGARYEV